ncbi:MAG: hypothetical protein AB1768_20480 [Pseudomonadota bacterium]|jgi:hypothetical protein
MLEEVSQLVQLEQDVITQGIPEIEGLNAAAPMVSWGGKALAQRCVAYRLDDPAVFAEVRNAMRDAVWNGANLVAHLDRPLRFAAPQLGFNGARQEIRTMVEAIYLLGPEDNPKEWLAVARLTRELALEEGGQLTYTASPGLLWDRTPGSTIMAWLLAADLGVLCGEEALRIAERALGRVRELQPEVVADDGAAWLNTRGIKLFASEFVRTLDEKATSAMAPIALPNIELPWSW